MDRLRALVIVLVACICSSAYAGYAQLTPPPGWSAGGGALATYQAASVSEFDRLLARPVASLAGAGRVPVGLQVEKVAAQRMLAARVGAAVVSGPASILFAGVTIAQAMSSNEFRDWVATAGMRYNAALNQFEESKEESCGGSLCLEWYGRWSPSTPERKSFDKHGFCQQLAADGGQGLIGVYEDGCVFERAGNRPFASRVVDQTAIKWIPVETPKAVQKLEDAALPNRMPNIVWPSSWPVSDPTVNPDASNKPTPVFVPTGNPIKNPNFDPSKPVSATNQPYLQPGVRVTGAPAPGDPWRVDVQPVNKPVSSSDPEENKEPDDPDSDKPQDQPSLCEKHPDIVACQKLGDIDPENLENKTVTLSINREEGFGPANASCPAPRVVVIMGQSYSFSWDLFCQFAQGIRPVVIAVAYLLAVLSFMGLSRKGD